MDITVSLIHSTVNEHLVDFLFGAITNSAAGNMVVAVFLRAFLSYIHLGVYD